MKTKSLFLILIPIFTSCSHSTAPPETRDFNFKFSYGVLSRNIINTFQNIYTKDLVMGGDTTIPFTLSPADLKQVMDKMNEIGFFEYPDTFIVPTGDTAAMVTPYPAYKFEVSNMQLNKHLTWEDDILNRNSQAAKLREFMRLIEGIIQSKPEYSQLPPIQGGYI